MNNANPAQNGAGSAAPERAPFTAFFGALAFPGLGHVLVGRVQRGIGWCCVAFTLWIAALGFLFLRLPLLLGLGLAAVSIAGRITEIADAVRCGLRPRRHFGTAFTRAVAVIGVGLALSAGLYGFALLWRTFLIEAYVMPTNGEMPTLVGPTVEGVCPTCKRPTPVSADERRLSRLREGRLSPDSLVGICCHCWATLTPAAYPSGSLVQRSPDRFIANKQLVPRRWDIVVFRTPFDPKVNFAKRIVGLPDETVELRDGEVTIDGKVVEKPGFLRRLKYRNIGSPRIDAQPLWGETGRPARLGPDEYFVLGDFSPLSKDSRVFEAGAPGHPSYAVPADNIIGVVTQIYWPPDRWRTFERAEE